MARLVAVFKRERIQRLIDFASRPENWFHVTAQGAPISGEIPGDDPRFVLQLGSLKCVFSWTEQGGRIWKHLTVDDAGGVPSPAVMGAIAQEFGIEGEGVIMGPNPLENCAVAIQPVAQPIHNGPATMPENDRDESLSMFTIYDHPRDYPTGYVVRRLTIDAGKITMHEAYLAEDLEAARRLVPPGLVRTPRTTGDDPAVLESWF